MSEIDAGIVSTSLEEPEIVSPPVTTPQEPAAPVADPVADPVDADPEGTISGAGGVKFVPLGAVTAERAKRKEAEKAAKEREAELAAIKPKAEEFDRSRQYLEQARPIIDGIRNRPDLVAQLHQPRQAPNEPQGPLSVSEAEDFAKSLDLYTQDGKPDIARAQKIAGVADKLAERKSQQAVSPILQTEAQRQSQAWFSHFLNQPEVNGMKVDPKLLKEAWDTVPIENSADPRVAQVLYMNTIGRQLLSGQKPITPLAPVVPTEAPGGARGVDTPLNDLSQRFRQAAGIAQKEFAERREAFKPGQNNSLE